MTLKVYQNEISINTLYETSSNGGGTEQLEPSIEIVGGAGDVYVSQIEPGAAPAGMTLLENGEALEGLAIFSVIANYLYVDQNSGTTTSIILSGVNAKEA